MAKPASSSARPLGARVFAWMLRAASVVAGAAVEFQQVYVAKTAQWPLVFLGLWFIAVPPALYFDGLRRFAQIATMLDALEQQQDSPPPAEEEPDVHRRR